MQTKLAVGEQYSLLTLNATTNLGALIRPNFNLGSYFVRHNSQPRGGLTPAEFLSMGLPDQARQ